MHLHCNSFHSLNVFNSLYQMQFPQRTGKTVAIKKTLSKLLGWKINLPWLSSVIPSLQVGSYEIIYPCHTHIHTFSISRLITYDDENILFRLYETQRLFHNKLTNMPCDVLKSLFARGGLCVFENNYKNELQMVLLSRYTRFLFGLTTMNCGREKWDSHKAEQSTYSMTCLFFSGPFEWHTLNLRERK